MLAPTWKIVRIYANWILIRCQKVDTSLTAANSSLDSQKKKGGIYATLCWFRYYVRTTHATGSSGKNFIRVESKNVEVFMLCDTFIRKIDIRLWCIGTFYLLEMVLNLFSNFLSYFHSKVFAEIFPPWMCYKEYSLYRQTRRYNEWNFIRAFFFHAFEIGFLIKRIRL